MLLALCDRSYILEIMLIVKTFFKLVCYIVPPIIIIVTIIGFTKPIIDGKEESLKENGKILVKRLIAGLLILFTPTLINYVFTSIVKVDDVEFIACMESATKEKVEALKKKEQAEEEAKKKQQEKEDQKKQQEAYKKEQQQREKRKQEFEKAKEEIEQNSHLTGNAWTNKLLSEAKSVTDYARSNDFIYGDAPINPAINHDARIVSCDRCVGWFLYNMGYTDQPYVQGVVVSKFPAWCEQHGFKKITSPSQLKAGDVVFVNPDANGLPGHVYLLGNPRGNGMWERYDCGSIYRIRLTNQYSNYSSQPFVEGIESFMYADRAKEAE